MFAISIHNVFGLKLQTHHNKCTLHIYHTRKKDFLEEEEIMERMALYCPYPLSLAIPAMAFAHLLIAGPIEGVITALVVRYLQASNSSLLSIDTAQAPTEGYGYKKLWWGLGALIVLSPLGLLASGTAWGEWGLDEMEDKLGFIPQGMSRLSESWHALVPDYGIPGLDQTFFQSAAVYIISALIGLVIIVAITYIFSCMQRKTRENN